MSITIYKDAAANAIFVEDSNGVQFLNSLQALSSDPLLTTLSIRDLAREIDLFTGVEYTEFVDQSNLPWGVDATSTINNLNAIFLSSGSTGEVPSITSSTAINSVEGDSINYELTATNGVAFEWDNLPTGLTTVTGNVRKLIGSIPASGTYTPTMKAINYFGEDSETLTITVSNPPFANTKSVRFNNNDYLASSAAALSSVLGRTGNGSGAADAWTISLYFKPGTHTGGGKQSLFFFGDWDYDNGGHVWVYYKGNEKAIYLIYGSKNNYIKLKSSNNSLTVGTWSNIVFTYDGGTTGSASGSVNDYYSRFSMFIDSVPQTTTNSNNNNGWSNSVDSDLVYVGRRASNNDYMKDNCLIDELAIWSSDQSSNVSSIYNGGVPLDLSSLATAPSNWWRMGDGDTFPILADVTGFAAFIMYNMTVVDIVNDVP